MRRAFWAGGWMCVLLGLTGCRKWSAALLDVGNEGSAAGECADAADNDEDDAFDCRDEGCAGSPDCEVAGASVPVAQAAPVEPAVEGQDWRSPSVGLMKWIPAGTFTMGSPEAGSRSDEVQHAVTLTRGFYLMEHEVTQAEWQAVMGSNPSTDTTCGPTCPVTGVSWDDASDFAGRLSAREGVTYRLPTEAEWEYAARAGEGSVYAGGDVLDRVGWYADNSGGQAHPVCGKARNAFGLCDMSGNACEWVNDRYGSYGADAVTDPVGASEGPLRTYRGGSWHGPAAFAQVAFRSWLNPGNQNDVLGLRLVRTPL